MRSFLRKRLSETAHDDEPNGSGVKAPETLPEWTARRAREALLAKERRAEEIRSERERRLLTHSSPTAVAWRDTKTGEVFWWDHAKGDDEGPGTKERPVRTFGMLQRRVLERKSLQPPASSQTRRERKKP